MSVDSIGGQQQSVQEGNFSKVTLFLNPNEKEAGNWKVIFRHLGTQTPSRAPHAANATDSISDNAENHVLIEGHSNASGGRAARFFSAANGESAPALPKEGQARLELTDEVQKIFAALPQKSLEDVQRDLQDKNLLDSLSFLAETLHNCANSVKPDVEAPPKELLNTFATILDVSVDEVEKNFPEIMEQFSAALRQLVDQKSKPVLQNGVAASKETHGHDSVAKGSAAKASTSGVHHSTPPKLNTENPEISQLNEDAKHASVSPASNPDAPTTSKVGEAKEPEDPKKDVSDKSASVTVEKSQGWLGRLKGWISEKISQIFMGTWSRLKGVGHSLKDAGNRLLEFFSRKNSQIESADKDSKPVPSAPVNDKVEKPAADLNPVASTSAQAVTTHEENDPTASLLPTTSTSSAIA